MFSPLFAEAILLANTSFALLAMGAERLWYAAPLIASVSLVYAATRHEETGAILSHAARFGLWILVFMIFVAIGLAFMGWLQ